MYTRNVVIVNSVLAKRLVRFEINANISKLHINYLINLNMVHIGHTLYSNFDLDVVWLFPI